MMNNDPFRINKVTVFIAEEEDGSEGVMGALLGEVFYPLVCADEARISVMFPLAEQIKNIKGQDYRIVQFSVREDVTDDVKARYAPTLKGGQRENE